MTDLSCQVRFLPDVLFRQVAGQSVLLNLKTEAYFGLDEVGTRMWRQLSESGTLQGAYEALQAEYEVAPDVLRGDLLALVGKLAEHGLIEIVEGGAAG